MAKKGKRVGGMDTTTLILLGVGGVAVLFLLMNSNKTQTTIVRTSPAPSTTASTTAAEIAAGASVINTALNDFSSDDNS